MPDDEASWDNGIVNVVKPLERPPGAVPLVAPGLPSMYEEVIASQAPDPVNHPKHYGGDTPYEAIKVIEAWDLGFCLGNVIKYLARAGKKPGTAELEDLEKARWYLDREIAHRRQKTYGRRGD